MGKTGRAMAGPPRQDLCEQVKSMGASEERAFRAAGTVCVKALRPEQDKPVCSETLRPDGLQCGRLEDGRKQTAKGLEPRCFLLPKDTQCGGVLRVHPLCRAVGPSCWGVAEGPALSGAWLWLVSSRGHGSWGILQDPALTSFWAEEQVKPQEGVFP